MLDWELLPFCYPGTNFRLAHLTELVSYKPRPGIKQKGNVPEKWHEYPIRKGIKQLI